MIERRSRARGARGISIVEVMVAAAVIAVALLATIGSIATSMRVTRTVTEQETAQRAAGAMVQELFAADFEKAFALYDANPANDPSGPGTAPGPFFPVPGLAPPDDVAAAEMGRIVFPTLGNQLREDVVIPALGMPRDLNGDGKMNDQDQSARYRILPALVEIRWKGVDGPGFLSMPCILAER